MQILTTTIIRAAALALLLGAPVLAFAQAAPAAGAEGGAQRQRLTQEQREDMRKRWEAMSPDERQKVIEERKARRAEALAKMTPEERQRSEARQQAARDRWAKMSPEERDAMRKRAAERRAQSGSRAAN